MADFNLSAAADSLIGAADVADSFFVNVAGDLAAADTVVGGAGTTTDRIVLTTAMTLAAADFANVGGIESFVFNAGGGSSVTLADAMVASTNAAAFFVYGGAGADRLLASGVTGTALRVQGGGGADLLLSGGGNDRLSGGSGNDTLGSAAGNDTLSGGNGADRLEAGLGDDRVDGGAGDDLIVFASGALTLSDLVADESGTNDTLQFVGGAAVAFTGVLTERVTGFERIAFDAGSDQFIAAASFGDDVESTTVTVDGGAGNDTLNAGAVAPLVPLDFVLQGGNGNDVLVGGRGNDTLDQGLGLAAMDGGAGNDVVIVRSGALTGTPTITGGASPTGTGSGDTLRVLGGGVVGSGQLAGITGFEFVELDPVGGTITIPDTLAAGVSATSFDLTVLGSDEDDQVITNGLAAGRDIIVRLGAGDDTVVGGAGDDTVYAGAGADTIQLATGTDRVVFLAGELNALDVVGADTLAGDSFAVTLTAGRTLAASAFGGVTGFDSFTFTSGAAGTTAAVRLPSNLVTQSGQASVAVSTIGSGNVVIDGRSAAGTWTLTGGIGSDTLFGGSGVNTLNGGGGADTLVGGDGGDIISLVNSGTDRDVALIRSINDGTVDINGNLSASALAGADQVSGLAATGNFIGVDPVALGLAGSATLFNLAGDNLDFGWGAIVLPTAEEIAGNAFGSLSAVRDVVGARLSGGAVGTDEKLILVIGGADEQQFGVYYFEDRDDNATIDVADVLMLLAIGDGDVPAFASGKGFTLTALDLG